MDGSKPFVATVGYVRSLKISTLQVYCRGRRAGGWLCHHQAVIPLGGLPDDLALTTLERRIRCTECGSTGPETRPNWTELNRPTFERAAGWMMPPSSTP